MSAADRAQRKRALDADGSFIVQAPAGSGKTELLTQRFLKLLARVEQPEQVLAITFTRKATQEMRERILHRLGQAAANDKPVEDHAKLAVEFARAVLEHDRQFGWMLQRNPQRLQVYTIDGLCARIAGRSQRVGHKVSGLGVNEDPGPLYRKAARRLIEDAGQPGAFPELHAALIRALTHMQGDAWRLHNQLAAMLARRDQWLRRMGVDHADMTQVLAMQQEAEFETLEAGLGAGRLESLMRELSALAGHLKDASGAATFMALHEKSGTEEAHSAGRVRLAYSALRLVTTKSGRQPYKPSSVAGSVIHKHDPGPEDGINTVRDILAHWHDDPRALECFGRFVATPPLDDDPGACALLEDFQRLLKAATAELQVLFMEEGEADFQHVAGLAMQALGDESGPGDALLAEDARLAHILMDEFQDTSHTQLALLRSLVSGWEPGDGRTLFLVGDPMQSIYRFREADVRLFTHVFAARRLGQVVLEPLRLAANFRSRLELIEWVNGRFPDVFGKQAGPGSGSVAYAPVIGTRDAGGRVTVNPWFKNHGAAEEARQVAALVKDRLAASPDVEIAVLARARKHLEEIAMALRKAGIAFEAVQVNPLGKSPVVLDLLAFTRAVLHPADRIAWLALLRAPWCGLSPAELLDVAGDNRSVDILGRLGSQEVIAKLPAERSARAGRLHDVMQNVLARRGRWSLSRLVEIAWIACHGPYAAGSDAELENAQAYFDLLAQVEREAHEDLLEVLRERLDALYAGSAAARVQLMTIHRAKGLEFDIVILPGLHRGTGNSTPPMLRLEELQLDGTEGVLMAPSRRRDAEGAGLYDYLGRLNREAETCEAQRTLYVAATRARRELHLFGGWYMKGRAGHKKPGCEAGSFMDLLWPCFAPVIDPAAAERESPASESSPPVLPQLRLQGEPGLRMAPPGALSKDAAPEMRLPHRNSTALGEALHLWLELMHDHWHEGWSPQWMEQHPEALDSSLARAGAEPEHIPRLRDALIRMLCKILESAAARSVLSPDNKHGSWAELALYSREGTRLRKDILDRLYREGDGSYTIVDYKTGSASPVQILKWAAQLTRYTELIEAVGKVEGASVTLNRPSCLLVGEADVETLHPDDPDA